jgi:predicted phage terminase large subunit-like protein
VVEKIEIRPQAGPQTAFLTCDADIAIFGGSAGGGKSYALLLDAVKKIATVGYGAVIFRRTLADVKKEGSLWDTSFKVYAGLGKPRNDNLSWRFPSRAQITFSHLEHEKDVLDWQGAQICSLNFDELTHFTRKQFFYMLSRNRSTCGVRPFVRATCNPDADSWVAELISWWIDQDTGFAIAERSGVVRWFVRVGDELRWGESKEALQVDYPDSEPKSLTFIQSSLTDNKILMDADPGYRANLLALDRVERARLLDGNWKIRPSSGLYFQRHWCEVVDFIPAGTKFVRGWDIAATEKRPDNDPDYTAGTKIGRCPDGSFIIADHVWGQWAPAKVESTIKRIAIDDGYETRIHIPQDPAAAGKAQVEVYRKLLAGFNVRFATAGGDKVTRFSGFSAQADPIRGKYGNVRILRATWNERLCTQLESFPPEKGRGHDDDADSTSEAFNGLVGKFGPGEAFLAMIGDKAKAKEAEPLTVEAPIIVYAKGSLEYADLTASEG